MSELSRFLGKPKTIKFDDKDVVINQLKTSDMDIVIEMSNLKTRASGMRKAIGIALRDNFPDVTNDEIEKLGMSYTTELMLAIMEVNGLSGNVKTNTEGESSKDNNKQTSK